MKFIKNIEKSGQKIISSILGIYYSIRFTLINKSTPKIPPAHLIARVDGQYGTVHFLKVSIVSWKTIIKSLRRVGININDFKNILDFGCGVARTLISANSQIKKTNFFGTDVDREAIEWCKKNIKNVSFQSNDELPPLNYTDNKFDFIYSISVFSHLNEDYQFKWIKEIARILKPGGIFLISIHGNTCWKRAPEKIKSKCSSDIVKYGFAFEDSAHPVGLNKSWYKTAFHTKNYIQKNYSKYFEILAHLEAGLGNYQDIVILKRK
jgi:cyclopropane fatty-acyl-phospholipid synthase-like methyltransferase